MSRRPAVISTLMEAGPVVLIGGGIGITPILSMAEHIAAKGSGRDCHIFVGARNTREAVGVERLRALSERHPNIRVIVCHSRPERAEDIPANAAPDHIGRVDIALLREVLPSNNEEFYLCGPSGMMHQLTADLEAWGVPASAIHYEAFGPASVGGGTTPPESTTAEPVEVVFTRRARPPPLPQATPACWPSPSVWACHWMPVVAPETVALARLPSWKVLSPTALRQATRRQPGSCLPCIARPRERLVLDA